MKKHIAALNTGWVWGGINRLAPLWLAALWVGVEAAEPFPISFQPFLHAASQSDSAGETALFLGPWLLAYVYTALLFLVIDSVCRVLARFRPWIARLSFRISAMAAVLGPVCFWSESPLWLTCAGIAAVCYLVLLFTQPSEEVSRLLPWWGQAGLVVGLLGAITLSQDDGWRGPSSPLPVASSQATDKPSFVWLALDGLPADFKLSPNGTTILDYWRGVESQASVFSEAYSAVNSSYASWFSAMSGRYPFRTGVDSPFPSSREGSFPADALLPNRLKALGYDTVFMTDCASTSFFSAEAGFNRRFEPDRGAKGCVSAYLKSRHVVLGAMISGGGSHPLQAQLDSECSREYRPETLFEKAAGVLEALNRAERPYFLALHSCSTRVPWRAGEVSTTVAEDSLHLRRTAPAAIQAVSNLVKVARQREKTLAFLFSDRGLSEEVEGASLAQVSQPRGRIAYHVPLMVIGLGHGSEHSQRVSLFDLYPTVLAMAGAPAVNSGLADGRDLFAPVRAARSLVLAGAMDLPLKSQNWTAVREGLGLGRNDEAAFSPLFESELRARATMGLLKGPERFLFGSDGEVSVFDEKTGTQITVPNSSVGAAFRELCGQYPNGICRAFEQNQG